MLANAVTTKTIWRSRYGRRKGVIIATAAAATMVGRMVGEEDEVS